MFEVFNMGIGFCYVVAPADADATLAILKKHGRSAQRIGTAVADPEKMVRIPQRELVGRHKPFRKDATARGRRGDGGPDREPLSGNSSATAPISDRHPEARAPQASASLAACEPRRMNGPRTRGDIRAVALRGSPRKSA